MGRPEYNLWVRRIERSEFSALHVLKLCQFSDQHAREAQDSRETKKEIM